MLARSSYRYYEIFTKSIIDCSSWIAGLYNGVLVCTVFITILTFFSFVVFGLQRLGHPRSLLGSPAPFLLMMLCLGMVQATPDKLFRINYGVIFNHIGSFHTVYDHWLHTFHVDLPTELPLPSWRQFCIPGKTRQREEMSANHNVCLQFKDAASSLFNIKSDTVTELNKMTHTISNLLYRHKQAKSLSRASRSILPIVGELSKSLFGLATERDVHLLARHIMAIQKEHSTSTKTFKQFQQKLSSYMYMSNKRISRVATAVQTNYDHLERVSEDLDHFTRSLAVYTRMSVAISRQLQVASNLHNQVEEYLLGVHELLSHKISPFLLPLPAIEETMNMIKARLLKDHPNYHLQLNSPSEVYANVKFIWAHYNNSIFITVKFPLAAGRSPLVLYKTESIPIPINESTTHVSQLLELPKYIGFSVDGMLYALPPELDAAACEGRSHRFPCHIPTPLIQRSEPCCISAIYHQDKQAVKELCNFRLVFNGHTSRIRHLSQGQYLISNIKSISLSCGQTQRVIKGCHLCVMKFPCGCAIKAEHFHIPAHVAMCRNQSTTSILHPVNLAVLQHMLHEDGLRDLSGDSLLTQRFPHAGPKFHLYKHNVSHILANDKRDDLNLQKIISAAKQDAQIYETAVDSLIATCTQSEGLWWWSNNVTTYLSFVCYVLSIGVIVYLFRQHRKMAATLAALQQKMDGTHAFRVHTVTTTTTTTNPPTDCVPVDWTDNPLALFLTVIISIIGIVILVKYLRRRYRCHAFLGLEFTLGSTCVIVPVHMIPLCPKFYHVQGSVSPSSFCCKLGWDSKLNIGWNDIVITNILTKETLELPNVISISLFSAIKLIFILKGKYYSFLLFQHGKYCYHVNICPLTCSTCPSLFNPCATVSSD